MIIIDFKPFVKNEDAKISLFKVIIIFNGKKLILKMNDSN